MSKIYKIKITDDIDLLRRVWSDEWADEHVGQVYKAWMGEDGWAYTPHAKFPPRCYTTLKIVEEKE